MNIHKRFQYAIIIHGSWQLATVYWVLLNGIHFFLLFSSLSLSTVKLLQQQIFILHRNLSEKVPNSEFILTQIGPDIANRENVTN